MTTEPTVGVVGYGEVGKAFSERLLANGFNVITINRSPKELRNRIDDGPIVANSPSTLAAQSEIVISCVWPETAVEMAEAMGEELEDTVYVDLNSIGPKTTRTVNRTVTDAGGVFLKGVIMDSVSIHGADAPILLAGPDITVYADVISEGGLVVKEFGTNIERPAALKMCRSMITKGMLALFVEALVTARYYGLCEEVLESVHQSFESRTPAEFARYFLVDTANHAERRQKELIEALETTKDANVQAPITNHTMFIHEAAAEGQSDIEDYMDMIEKLAPHLAAD